MFNQQKFNEQLIMCNKTRFREEKVVLGFCYAFVVVVFIAVILLIHGCSEAWAEGLQASWYSSESLIKEGTRKIGERQVMANGQLFSDTGLTAASCDWRLGQKVKVTRTDTKASVVVLVTDRTAKRFKGKRIDLSKRAFEILSNGKLERGLLPVIVTEVATADDNHTKRIRND
jgi:rare lipoprotein A (peptidoglycan hydrolase)